MKVLIGLQVFIFFMSLAGMLLFGTMYHRLGRPVRKIRLRSFASRAYDVCVSILLTDGIIALVTLSSLGIIIIFS